MKKALAVLTVLLAVGLGTAFDAEARRLGGARSSGMQRQSVTQPAHTPAAPDNLQRSPSQAAPAAAPANTAAAAAPKRSWLGPVAGIAAGLGLAALASHLGFGAAFANLLTIALIAMAAFALVGFFLRKRQGPALAGAGAPGETFRTATPQPQAQGGSLIGSRVGGAPVAAIPADFDAAGFARNAKAQFLALQSANDAGDLTRLREYLTPEMFEVVRAEVQERAGATQRTEAFGLEAQVLEVTQDDSQYVASVRFTGSVREQPGAAPEDLDEVWHLVKPRWGNGGWVIAGIQQLR